MQDAASSRASLSMRGETLRDETMQGPYDETVTGEWALASRAPPSAEPEGRFEGIPLTQFLPKTERAPACESADSRQSSVASGSVGTPCGLGLTTAQSCLVGGSRAPSLSHRLSARCSSDLAASLSFRSGSAAAKQARLELSQARSPRAIASALSQYKGVVRTRSEIPAAFRKTASEATQQPPSATMLPFAKSISVGSLTSHGSAASSAAASDAGGAEGKGSKRAGSILAQLGQLKDLKALLAEREDEILDCVALGETLLGEVASLRAGTDAYAPCAAELTPILQRLHGYLSDSAGDRANLAGEKRTLLNTVETVQGLVDEAVELAASEGYVPAAAAAAAGRGEGEEEEEAPAPAELVAGLVRICGHLHADMRNKEGDARTARRQSVCYTDRVATARALEELEETRTLLERKESDLRKQKEDLSWCQRETLKYTEGEIAAYALQLEAAQDALRADRRAAEEASEAASRAALRGAHADALGDAALRALAEAAAVASGLAAELSSARSAAEKAEAAEARAAALQAEAEELRGCLGGAEERTRALEVENGLCADRLSQLGTALHAAMDAAETAELGRQALEVSKREGADLRAENEALRAAAGVAGAAEAEATRLAGELQQRLESQQATFSSLEEARQGWEAACDEAAALRAALEEAEAVGAEEAAARGAAAAEHERLVRQVEAEVAELERQLGDLASGGQAAEAEAARLRAALAEAEAEAAQAAAAAASLEAAQQKEAEEAELVVDELRAINAAYKTRLAELGEEHRVAEGKLGELCAVLSGCDGLLVESYTPSVLADATPARVAELLCRVARGRGEADARARALEDRLSATQAELAAAQEAAEAAAARGRVLEMDAGREAQRAERLAARVAQEACDAEELQRLRCGEETLQAALAAQAGVVDGLERRVAEVEGGRDEAARLLEERTTQAAAEEAAGRALSARLLEDEVNVELLAERLQSTQGLLEQRDAEAFNLQGRLDAVQAELEGLAVRYEQVTLKTAEEEAARAEERKELEGLRERVAQAERMDKAAQEDPIVDKMMRRAEAMRAMEVTRHCYAERLEVYQASVSSLMELNEREPADVLASPAGAAVSARRTTRLTGGSLSEDAGASAMHERFSRLQSKLERLDMDLQDSQQCHKKAESEMQRTSEVLRESAARTHKQLQSASSSAHRPYATRLLSGKV